MQDKRKTQLHYKYVQNVIYYCPHKPALDAIWILALDRLSDIIEQQYSALTYLNLLAPINSAAKIGFF